MYTHTRFKHFFTRSATQSACGSTLELVKSYGIINLTPKCKYF